MTSRREFVRVTSAAGIVPAIAKSERVANPPLSRNILEEEIRRAASD
jgi:hypothetical protein